MFKNIPKSDISIRAFNVYKEWNFDETNISIIFGKKVVDSAFDPDIDEKSGNFYKRLVYDSIKNQYYVSPTTASVLYGKRIDFTSDYERLLGDEIGVISLPQKYMGNGIRPGSVTISDPDTGLLLVDDRNSNMVSGSIVYGNVFYENGLIVLTNSVTSGSNWNRYELQYNSTKTIYENEIFISVDEGEFNYSSNPTALVDVGGQSKTIKITDPNDYTMQRQIDFTYYNSGTQYVKTQITFDDGSVADYRIVSINDPNFSGGFDDYEKFRDNDPTGSYLAPYITTIGLYDDDGNMVAIAKLPQPIKSLPDYPINFLIRFDT
jgi:hypothetical protein